MSEYLLNVPERELFFIAITVISLLQVYSQQRPPILVLLIIIIEATPTKSHPLLSGQISDTFSY